MRFSDRITFVQETEAFYDPRLGRWVEGLETFIEKPCKLTELGTERTTELFGRFDRQLTVARLQRPHLQDFNHVLVDGTKFEVQRQSNYRKGVLYLERVMIGG